MRAEERERSVGVCRESRLSCRLPTQRRRRRLLARERRLRAAALRPDGTDRIAVIIETHRGPDHSVMITDLPAGHMNSCSGQQNLSTTGSLRSQQVFFSSIKTFLDCRGKHAALHLMEKEPLHHIYSYFLVLFCI